MHTLAKCSTIALLFASIGTEECFATVSDNGNLSYATMEAASPAESGMPAEQNATFVHPWYGIKVGYIGDSITDPNNGASGVKYWNLLQDWLGIVPWVYGVSGREWNDAVNQADQLKAEHGDDVDAIMIFLGTNDFNSGVPLGMWFEECEEEVEAATGQPRRMQIRKKRTPSMNPGTFRGRINAALSHIKNLFPDKQVVLLTPIHRAYAIFGDTNVQPDENYTNLCGEYIDAYVQAVKEAGNIWSVPVIDLNAVSGLNPMVEAQIPQFANPQTDRLHPSDAGHRRLASTLYYQLLALPARF